MKARETGIRQIDCFVSHIIFFLTSYTDPNGTSSQLSSQPIVVGDHCPLCGELSDRIDKFLVMLHRNGFRQAVT